MPKTKKKKAVAAQPAINQAELMEIEALRLDLQRANKIARDLKWRVEAREAELIDRLKGGAPVQGHLNASVDVATGQCRPPWKDIYLDHYSHEHGVPRESEEERMRLSFPGEPYEVLVIAPKAKEKSNA